MIQEWNPGELWGFYCVLAKAEEKIAIVAGGTRALLRAAFFCCRGSGYNACYFPKYFSGIGFPGRSASQ